MLSYFVKYIIVIFFVFVRFSTADPSECKEKDKDNSGINRKIVYLERSGNKFFAVISLGVPLQDFNVALNFKSSVLWVPGSNCRCAAECKDAIFCKENCGEHCCEQGNDRTRINDDNPSRTGTCTNKLAFRVKKSKPYTETHSYIRLKYEDDVLLTFMSLDQLSFGTRHAPGITAPHVEFGLLQEFPASYEEAVYDGIFGLVIKDEYGNRSVMKQLFDRKILQVPILSIWINNGKGDLQLVDGSMTVGAVDERVCMKDPSATFALTAMDKWIIQFNEAAVDIQSFIQRSWRASFDLDEPNMVVPPEIFEAIKTMTQARKDENTGEYYCYCSTKKLRMTFAKTLTDKMTIETSLENFMTPASSQVCLLQMRPSTSTDPTHWILNSGIAKDYCVILDYRGHLHFSKVKEPK